MPSRINGQVYQHALIDLASTPNAGGTPFHHRRFTELKFVDRGKKTPIINSNGEIAGYQISERETEGSISLLLAEWSEWRDWLYKLAADISSQIDRKIGPGQVQFSMIVSFGNRISDMDTRVLRAMVQEEAFESTNKQDAIETKIPLFVLDVTDKQGRRFVERE